MEVNGTCIRFVLFIKLSNMFKKVIDKQPPSSYHEIEHVQIIKLTEERSMYTIESHDLVVATYGAYLAISIGITVWVAQTLSKSGELFLVDVFGGNKELAKAVNHLLVVGFYLVNLGFVSLFLKIADNLISMRQSIEALSGKVGIVLLVLGVMHFINMVVFKVIRSGSCADNPNPPVMPDGFTTMGGSN